jgi:hypothetical protein
MTALTFRQMEDMMRALRITHCVYYDKKAKQTAVIVRLIQFNTFIVNFPGDVRNDPDVSVRAASVTQLLYYTAYNAVRTSSDVEGIRNYGKENNYSNYASAFFVNAVMTFLSC